MVWYRIALQWMTPSAEEQIFDEVVTRNDEEIKELVQDNVDIVVEQAQHWLDIGSDLEQVIDRIARDFGRSFDFSPKRTLEWASLWMAIFEIVAENFPPDQEWSDTEIEIE